MDNVKSRLGEKVKFAHNEYDVLKEADALLICTEWSIFRNPNFDKMKEIMSDAVVFDGRNLYAAEEMNGKGFYYQSIGRSLINK
jgi:UDPglucose 6-dehydrogenase